MRRRVATRRFLQTLTVVAVVGLHTAAALAVCGDANGDGSVSVSDGVQTLRAAASLSSSCDNNCDVDGSGTITVSDGVNVLRKAAGLASVDACPTNGNQVSTLIGHTLDLFGPLTKVGAIGATAAGSAFPCDNPDGGFQQSTGGFTFNDCVIDNVSLTGFLGVGNGSLDFSNLAVRRAGDVLTLSGSLSVGDANGNPALSGVLAGDSVQLGSYVITFQDVVRNAFGTTIDGTLVFDTSDADIQDVIEVRVTLTGGTSLPVVVRFTDQTTGNFSYNPDTDVLTPVEGTPTPTPTATPPAASVRLFNIDDNITAILNGTPVLQAASTGPGATNDTGLVTVQGLRCGDNRFDFVVNNAAGNGGGYTFGVQLQVGGALVVDRTCGQAGFQGCDNNNTTVGEVARDVTFFCVPCGPCSASTAGTCANPLQIPPSGRIQIHGRTAGSSALSSPCSGGGPESVFRFTPASKGCYEFGTCGTGFDSQLATGDGLCPGTGGPIEEQCFDNDNPCADKSTRELTFRFMNAGEQLTIVLDGAGGSQAGTYILDVRPSGRCLF